MQQNNQNTHNISIMLANDTYVDEAHTCFTLFWLFTSKVTDNNIFMLA